MPKIKYDNAPLSARTRATIVTANEIIVEYVQKGYQLTLRQLYYQFVARGLITNSDKSYNRLGDAVDKGRLAGLIDWSHIHDMTRSLRQLATWDSPQDRIQSAQETFRTDLWDTQPYHLEVWIEKDALAGVISRVCEENRVPYFSCRGYTSQSSMWRAGQRLSGFEQNVILHLGDHDPSGIDMTRDIEDRLNLFMSSGTLEVRRLALNIDQVRQFNPPPNPAKMSDSRAEKYVELYGNESWELDALSPETITELIEGAVNEYRDADLWDQAVEREEHFDAQLKGVTKHWPRIVELLEQESNDEDA